MSSSFDAEEGPPRRDRDDEHTTPSTQATLGLSVSQLSTPIMSQPKAFSLFLNTPPTIRECNDKITGARKSDAGAEDAPTSLPPFSPSQQTTPAIFKSDLYDTLEPPAWKPPDTEEIEYTDAWNNTYNAQHHYMQPNFTQDDSSTIGSSQTNNSFANNFSINAPTFLRPRGLSVCSYTDAVSVGSCPQPQRGQAQHRRHPSLPVSFFSSTSRQGSREPLHQLFPLQQGGSQNQLNTNKQYALNLLQTKTKRSPYELHSSHHLSQVQADGAMAGLKGIMLDLYTVDRTVDGATARMLATKDQRGGAVTGAAGEDVIFGSSGDIKKKMDKQHSSQKSRKTSVGTLNDIQCILELHKVDKIVDRFKRGLQMPQFFEEEAWENKIWKDLRKTDVEIEEYNRRKKSMETNSGNTKKEIQYGRAANEQIHYQFDLSDEEEEGSENKDEVLPGEDIYKTAESFLTYGDAYQFFDPHETEALHANSYQSSYQVSASISDNLNEIVDLLRTDVEVDGASKRHHEMAMIKPLLEVDQEVNKWKRHSQVRDMWDANLRALYGTDLEVVGARRKQCTTTECKKVKAECKALVDAKVASLQSSKPQDPVPLSSSAAKSQPTDQEVKHMLSQHIPQVSQPFCPTSPELMAPKASIFHGPSLSLSPPPAPMLSSPQQSYRRSIFPSAQQKNNNAPKIMPKAVTAKRSIFSRKEKSSAAHQCAYQRGVMMPGTTTVVMAKGGEMIDDIPVGKVVATSDTK